jgi:23S rRNA-/tRNA-specific pseudouridylate synthase
VFAQIEIKLHSAVCLKQLRRYKKVRIVYEDRDVVVVDKPRGLAVHGKCDCYFHLLFFNTGK